MNQKEKEIFESIQAHLEQAVVTDDRRKQTYHVRESLQLLETLQEKSN